MRHVCADQAFQMDTVERLQLRKVLRAASRCRHRSHVVCLSSKGVWKEGRIRFDLQGNLPSDQFYVQVGQRCVVLPLARLHSFKQTWVGRYASRNICDKANVEYSGDAESRVFNGDIPPPHHVQFDEESIRFEDTRFASSDSADSNATIEHFLYLDEDFVWRQGRLKNFLGEQKFLLATEDGSTITVDGNCLLAFDAEKLNKRASLAEFKDVVDSRRDKSKMTRTVLHRKFVRSHSFCLMCFAWRVSYFLDILHGVLRKL